MKTQVTKTATAPESQPGNLTTRQLAQSLIKTVPATAQTAEDTAAAETETSATDRERSPALKGKSKSKATDLSDADASAETEADLQPDPDPEPSTDEVTPAEETPEPAEEPEAQETTDPEPEETPRVSEVVSERLNAELAPLIADLQQAGAKGALQILQKRIPKLTDQRDTERNARLQVEEHNAQLRRELQEARTQKPSGGAQAPVSSPEVAQVNGELSNVDHWLAFCEDALPKLNAGETEHVELPNGKGQVIQLNAKQVAAIQRDLQNQRSELAAQKAVVEQSAKAEYKRQYSEHHAAAVSEYPWLKNPQAPENQEMQAILQVFPAFKQSPDFELAIGDFIAGKALREARAKAKGKVVQLRKPAPSREPTRVVTTPPGGGADRDLSVDKEVKAAEAQFRKTGRTADLAKLNSAKARASRAQRVAKAA